MMMTKEELRAKHHDDIMKLQYGHNPLGLKIVFDSVENFEGYVGASFDGRVP